jgi:hypothetical protein
MPRPGNAIDFRDQLGRDGNERSWRSHMGYLEYNTGGNMWVWFG